MSKIKCPRCKALNPNNAEYCSSCQLPLKNSIQSLLKVCPKCRKIYKSDVEYCTKCQCELIEKAKSKSNIVILSLIIGVIFIACIIIVSINIYPAQSFEKVIQKENSTALVEIFELHPELLDSDKNKEIYNNFIILRANKYINDEISYDEISQDFQNFTTINNHLIDSSILDTTTENYNTIKSVYTSRLAFDDAEFSYDNQDYQLAEQQYSEVITQDKKYYNIAQEKLQEINELKNSYLSQSNEKSKNGDYEGSIEILTNALTYFGYDEKYNDLYHEKIIENVVNQSDYLMKKSKYFSYNGENGAFNLVYSYLNEEYYTNNPTLEEKLYNIVNESELSELTLAEKNLGLINKSKVLDRCADTSAKDYYNDSSIQDNNSYILDLCKNDDGVQNLLSNIVSDGQINVALISDFAMTAEDFSNVSREKLDLYSNYTWHYTGIGRYFDKENKSFSWAIIIIYELE